MSSPSCQSASSAAHAQIFFASGLVRIDPGKISFAELLRQTLDANTQTRQAALPRLRCNCEEQVPPTVTATTLHKAQNYTGNSTDEQNLANPRVVFWPLGIS